MWVLKRLSLTVWVLMCIFPTSIAVVGQDNPFGPPLEESPFGSSDKGDSIEIVPSTQIMRNTVDPATQVLGFLLRKDSFRNDLNLDGIQIDEIERILKSAQSRFEDAINKQPENGEPKLTGNEIQKMTLNALRESSELARKQIEEVLLPGQLKRTNELIAVEVKKQLGLRGLFASQWLKNELGLTDRQSKMVSDRIKRENKILKEDIQKMVEIMKAQ